MSLLVLLPIVMALTVVVALGFYTMKRTALVQATCMQEAAQMQENLRRPLRTLVNMNPEAKALREERDWAEEDLRAARSSGVPYWIAAAEAFRELVVLEQTLFHARQLELLAEAKLIRVQGEHSMYDRGRALRTSPVQARTYYFRPLAVEPKPKQSLSPDYVPVENFETRQQQRYQFEAGLLENWPFQGLWALSPNLPHWRIHTECAVTMKGEEPWDSKILAANLRLNSSSF